MISDKNQKIPLYVSIYNDVFNMIKEGVYKPDDQLPTEQGFSEMFGVSRGTVRQALMLLQEDGLVINHQGKGHFVASHYPLKQMGLEQIGNTHEAFCNREITDKEIDLTFQLSTQKQEEALGLKETQLLAVFDMVYRAGEMIIGHTMAFMTYEELSKYKVKLEDPKEVIAFYGQYIKEYVAVCKTSLRVVYARESTAQRMGIEPGDSMVMLEEVMYSKKGTAVLRQKSFFLPDECEFHIHRGQ